MGKITPRFLLIVLLYGLFIQSVTPLFSNITYGPETPILKDKNSENFFFVGFYLNAAPTITAPGDKTVDNNSRQCYASNVDLGSPQTSGEGNVKNDAPNQFPVGNTTVTWTITNEEGTDSDTQVITVIDNENPNVIAPGNVTKNTDNNECTASNVSLGTPNTNDNCGIKNTTNDAPSVFPIGETTVTWTATDNSDNTATATQTVTVVDNQNPTISAPANVSVNTDNNECTASNVSLGAPNTNDNCGIKNTTNDAPSVFPVGETTVTWTVTDNSDNTATATQTVTVVDIQNPIISAPANLSVDTDNNNCTASNVNLGTPNTNDNCGIKDTTNDAPSVFPIGETTVTWTVTDNSDNTATATQTVTVVDNQAPVKPSLPDISWTCGTEITAFPTTTDNCDTEITGTTGNPLEFDSYGEYIITWTFTDSSENSVTAEQLISIPEPTVEIPSIDGNEYCNTEEVSGITFSGNELSNKRYEWFYETNSNANIGLASSGTNDIPAFTAINNTSSPIEVKFSVIPFGGNCEGEENYFFITINPTPTITTPNDIEICKGETVNTIDLSSFSVMGSTVEWTNDNPNIGLAASGTGNITSFTANNDTNESQIATILLTPSANNCTGETQSFTIEVKPNPGLETPVIPELCNGAPTETIDLSGNFTGITYDISGGSSIGLSNRTNVTEIPVFTPVNNSEISVNATITITPKADGCIGEPIEIPLTVKPSPVVGASFTNQICSGEITDISLASAVANTGFTWTVDAPAGIEGAISGSLAGEGIIEHKLTNNTSQPQNVTYRISPEAEGCTGSTIPVVITVNPTPEFEVIEPEPICSPAEVDLTSSEITVSSTSSLTFTYWNDEAATDEIDDPTTVKEGTYYIKATTNNDCYLIKPITVRENPIPELTSSLQAPGFCSETAFEYEFTSNVPGIGFNWTREATEGISTTGNSGSGDINEVIVNETTNPIEVIYEVTLISPEGCSNIQEITTTVTPTPLLTSTLTPEGICSGINFTYEPTSETTGTVFSWTREAVDGISNPPASGTGSIDEILENTTIQPIGVTYTYFLASNNCENPQEYKVNVIVTPSPDTEVQVSISGENNKQDEIEICAGENIDLFSTTSFIDHSSLPFEVLSSNFNNGNQGWNLNPDSGNFRWKLTSSGVEAYRDECEWWEEYFYDCQDETVNFRSNSNDQFFLVNSHDFDGDFDNIRLESPVFNTQGYNTLNLSFWHHYRDGGARWSNQRDIGYLQSRYKNSNGNWTTWTNIDTYTSTVGDADNFVQRNYNIDNLINRDAVQIRFRYHNANNDWYWGVDNVLITGNGTSSTPEVEWTSNMSDWTSNEENPSNISTPETTTYTATYINPETGCPGSASVKVVVREPLQPRIVADYCLFEESNRIRLSADREYDSYRWESAGERISNNSSIDISLAQTYTLYVTRDGCEASASITPNENLIRNGNFDDPEYTLPYNESRNFGERDIISNGDVLFTTRYDFKVNRNDNPDQWGALGPEGTMAIGEDANDYHSNFNGLGHGGQGNFLIVNGDVSIGNIVWQSKNLQIIPDTDYYFSAWTANVNPASPARLRIQVLVDNTVVVESNLGDLTNEPVGNWINFYNPELWNSGNNTEATVRIINENPTAGGNDFGIDDISFSAFRSFDFEFTPENNGPICEDETIELAANLDGGRFPITFNWTGPNGFTRSKTINEESERVAADTIQIPNATAEMAGEYSLQITDFYGCNLESKTTMVEVVEKAVVFAGEDMEICSNEPIIDLSSASITHPSINSGFWSTAAGDNSRFTDPNLIKTTYTPNEDEIASGEIELILTSNEDAGAVCEIVSDTINIIFNISPELELISQDVSCFEGDNGEIEINIIENTGTAPFTFLWSDGQTGRIAENLVAGDYYADVTDAKGCTVRTDTITIQQPEELIVGAPIELEEASCFDDFGAVVSIPVSGGLFAEETIDPENISYILDILDAEGNQINLGQEQIIYDIATERFIISGLQGGKGYTFLVSSSENCAAEVKTFTTLTPPEINAGEVPEISECGIKTLWLAASPIDPEIGTGSWSYNNGETALLGDPDNPNTSFTGQPGQTYTLNWSVSSVANESCSVTDEIEITFPPSCSQLNFDGIDDFVDLGDHYNINSSFSIEAWVKPHSISGTKTILSKRSADNMNAGYDLFLNNGSPTFRVNNKSVVSGKKINTDRWFHIAAVYNEGSALRIYVDGIEIQTNTTNIPQSIGATETPALIGAAFIPDETIESKDHFEGYIEEVRFWNTAIPIEQIRFFMNQRLEKDGTNVSGTVLGNNLNLPNTPQTIEWNKLTGYYQLLAQNDLISDGFTDNLGSTGETTNGLLKNIQEMQENTAPVPYILYTSGQEWFNKTTWKLPQQLNGKNITKRDVWDPPSSQGIDNSRITWNIVKLSEDIENPATQNNQNNISLLGLISEKGILNMKGENNMGQSQTGFGTGNALTITHYLELNGYIDLNGESQLIQTEGSKISGSGGLERDQQGTASSYNYNYWSSPVLPNSNSQNYKVNQVMKDGSTVGTKDFQNINFKWAHTHADGEKANPIKISDYWINAFRARKANEYSQWEQIGSYTALKPGEGYTMKGTTGDAKIIDLQNYTFTGFPNNGTIEVSEIKPGQNYLLGNPYPSAISVEEFILDNIKKTNTVNGTIGRNEQNLINGAVYFWDHFGGKTHYLSQYVGGYATRNLIDGVSAISNDSRINATGASSNRRAGPYIPVGQGFFVNTTLDAQPGDIDDFGSGNIVFKNSQRSFVMERGQSFSFFLQARDNKKTSKNTDEKSADSRYKIRLKFHSPTGYHREILVGADARTSQGFDLGFDAPLIDKGKEDMYWVVGEGKYVIQGVPHFNLDQRLPLGIKIAEENEFSIEISELHNLPDIVEIYLRNNSDSTYHDLRKEAFKDTLPAGEYQDLYEIVFQDITTTQKDEKLGEETVDFYYSMENREFVISNPEFHKIEHINIYNITGQLVDQHFGIPDIKEIHIPQKKSLSSAVYIVKVFTSAGDYAKKVIIRKD
ncbi:PKD-like domain-containing protein [Salegentibacter salegens]|uniref:Por secretion system C-terminal sorting domain-containing protein n=1 Tax=Salegentibacter salegens TaxID=143223 RepID=A0A1M7L170_9FLAO|nr:PKD-like domain-containing protein [Salegentibacter salegens]PRX44857.1 putative secreted protein (Por secretion system target) [Salegentibacter salegens]SHM71464.1 Por secretion system C-terminal sorting domain-containing protein [Salegentibacter salegens]